MANSIMLHFHIEYNVDNCAWRWFCRPTLSTATRCQHLCGWQNEATAQATRCLGTDPYFNNWGPV